MTRYLRFLTFVAFVAIASACAATQHGDAGTTVSAFAQALSDRDFAAAYEMMSVRYREQVTFEMFRDHLTSNAEETSQIASSMTRITGPADERALVTYGDGEELELVRDRGVWRIATNVVDFYDQSTPRAALLSFIRAMKRGRYDVVMRMVPSADREGMSADRMREVWEGEGREEVQRLLANLEAATGESIEIVGSRATMTYGNASSVQFLLEDGVWKIEDPE